MLFLVSLADKIAQTSLWAYKLSFRFEAKSTDFKLRA